MYHYYKCKQFFQISTTKTMTPIV